MPVILLIDDNRMLTLVEARSIQRSFADTNIVVASNGASIVELAKARQPDVTILDAGLAQTNALSIHRSLCDIVAPDSIIVTSNHPSPPFAALKLQGEIADLLTRPFPISTLVSRVEDVLKAHDIEVTPYHSSVPATPASELGFDRHLALNQLSGILGALRAFEAEVEADGNAPDNIRILMEEYVPRIVDLIQDVAQNIKRSRKDEIRQ